MSKLIEPGCRVRVVWSECGNEGKEFTVLRPADAYKVSSRLLKAQGNRWEVDGVLTAFTLSGRMVSITHVGENTIERIDDDGRKLSSWAALEGIYSPPVTVGDKV